MQNRRSRLILLISLALTEFELGEDRPKFSLEWHGEVVNSIPCTFTASKIASPTPRAPGFHEVVDKEHGSRTIHRGLPYRRRPRNNSLNEGTDLVSTTLEILKLRDRHHAPFYRHQQSVWREFDSIS